MTHTHHPTPGRPALSRTPGRGLRLALTMCCAVLVVLWTAPSASAHSTLISSNPADGSVLAAPPTTITMTFSQHVLPDNDEVAVTVGTAAPVDITPTIDGPDVIANLTHTTLPAFDPHGGAVTWKIGFRIISADGHPVTGLYTFTVGTGPPAAATTPATAGGGHWMWPTLAGVIVLLALLTLLLLRARRRTPQPTPQPTPTPGGLPETSTATP